jgi:glycosyltransferase involved in cell wall biosynthesis
VKVGFFSPLPPVRTGVADYAAALLEGLRRRVEVAVEAADADVFLYHLGNNPLHHAIYERALANSGVVVLHDAVLHHYLLGTLGERAYIEEFVYNYGEWYRGLAEELWRERARSAQDPRYFEYPMLKRVAEASRAVVVHNPAAAALVTAHCPRARVFEIPHLCQEPPRPPLYEIVRLRDAWGVRPSTFLFGVFGYLREAKRLLAVLRAFARTRAVGVDAALLVAGEFVSADLARAAQSLLAQPGVIREGFAPEERFWTLAGAVDACINLRYPAAGETSGISIRLMSLGKPVLVTGSAENARFPETACLRVPVGPAEVETLAEYMLWLARFPESARQIGLRAAAHVAAEHSLDVVCARYVQALGGPNPI